MDRNANLPSSLTQEDTANLLFSLLRSVFKGEKISLDAKALSADSLKDLYALAKAHDMVHLLAPPLYALGVQGEAYRNFEKQQLVAVMRYEKLAYIFSSLCDALENEKIPFIPLKGSVIRDLYPAPFMRTSGDIDIFVAYADLSRATALLVSLGYTVKGEGAKEKSFYTPNGVLVELHFTTGEETDIEAKVFHLLWENATVKPGKQYQRALSWEYFYLYHITHMAKHFLAGGCGIRNYLDIYILQKKVTWDPSKKEALLASYGLLRFAEVSEQLADAWFENGGMSDAALAMQKYVLKGGSFGNTESRTAMRQIKKKGKVRHFLSHVFLSLDAMKKQYRVLERHKWLLPFCEVHRWFCILLFGKKRGSFREMQNIGSIQKTEREKMEEMLKDLDLS